MAFQPDINPQPVSIADPVEVIVNSVTVSDTSRYFNANIADDDTDVTIQSNITTGHIVEILSINLACGDTTDVFSIHIKSALGLLDADKIGVLYCIGGINTSPNIRFTIPGTSDNDLIVSINRISGSGTANVAFSVVYRVTAP